MTCVAPGDGLINPDLFPCRAEGLDTSKIEASAEKLRTMGKTVNSCASDVDRVWKGLPNVYKSPSADAAYGLMAPAVSKADTINESFSKAADALDTYASNLSGIKRELQDVENEAREFRKEAEAGYDKPRFHLRTGLETGVDHISWKEHEPAVQRNKDLLDRYARLLTRISEYSADCADSINGLVSGAQIQKAERVSAQDIMNAPTPWGAPVDKDPSCPESVGAGVVNFGKSTWEGGTSLLGFNENGWSWSTFINSLVGVGDFVVSTAVATSPLSRGALRIVGDDEVDAWLDRRVDVAATAWGGMIGFDWQTHKEGGNGWHRYLEEDGIAVFTESVLNVGSLFVPGAGQAGAGLKIVAQGTRLSKLSKLAKLANAAGTGAEMLFTGGSWVVKAGTTGLGKLISATDSLLDTIAPKAKGLDGPGLGKHADGVDLPTSKGPSVDGAPSSTPRGIRPGAGLANAANGPSSSAASASLGLDGAGPSMSRSAGGSGIKPPAAGLDPHNRPRLRDSGGDNPDAMRPGPDGPESPASHAPETEAPRRRSPEVSNDAPGTPRRAAPENAPASRAGDPPEPRASREAGDPAGPKRDPRTSDTSGRPGDVDQPRETSRRQPEARPEPEPKPEPESQRDPDGDQGRGGPERARPEPGSGRWNRPSRFIDDAARAADAAGDTAPAPKEPGSPAAPDTDHVPSLEDVPDQKLAEPGQTPDADSPGYDTDGNPLKTDRGDGRAHYANDPEGTYRLSSGPKKGALRWLHDNTFTDDPYTTSTKDVKHFADYSAEPRQWTNPEYAEMFRKDVAVWEEARTAARRDRAAALEAMDQAAKLTVDGKPVIDTVNKSFADVAERLDSLAEHHPALADEATALRKKLKDAGKSAQWLRETSEWVGDRAGYLHSLDQAGGSRTVLLGKPGDTVAAHSGPGAGAVDQVSIDNNTLYVGENKGGNNPALGSRATDAGRAQQGTLQYLRDLLTGKNPDTRLVEALEALKDSPEHAEFYKKLTTEGVDVVYEMVNARSNGTVKVGRFDLHGPVKIKLVDGHLVLDTPTTPASSTVPGKGTP